jgi:hypothetical protein
VTRTVSEYLVLSKQQRKWSNEINREKVSDSGVSQFDNGSSSREGRTDGAAQIMEYRAKAVVLFPAASETVVVQARDGMKSASRYLASSGNNRFRVEIRNNKSDRQGAWHATRDLQGDLLDQACDKPKSLGERSKMAGSMSAWVVDS